MIIDDKVIMLSPPPPYLSPRESLSTAGRPTLTTLPPHILLEIIYNTFPSDFTPKSLFQDAKPLRQRRILFWLSDH